MTWTKTVEETLDAFTKALEEVDDLDGLKTIVMSTGLKHTTDCLNAKSLAKIATALEKLANIEDEVETDE